MQADSTDSNNSNLGDSEPYYHTELRIFGYLEIVKKNAQPQSQRDGNLQMKDERHSLTSCRGGNVSRIPPHRELQQQ